MFRKILFMYDKNIYGLFTLLSSTFVCYICAKMDSECKCHLFYKFSKFCKQKFMIF